MNCSENAPICLSFNAAYDWHQVQSMLWRVTAKAPKAVTYTKFGKKAAG